MKYQQQRQSSLSPYRISQRLSLPRFLTRRIVIYIYKYIYKLVRSDVIQVLFLNGQGVIIDDSGFKDNAIKVDIPFKPNAAKTAP
jgi:hypothetical protein